MKHIKHSAAGLTLIEVLIALAVIAIAMMAVIKTTSENIRSTIYLYDKSAALWVAQAVMSEIDLGLINLATSNGSMTNTMKMVNKTWVWQASETETPLPEIQKVTVRVFRDEDEKLADHSLLTLEAYVTPKQ